jgi:hypothetical protein
MKTALFITLLFGLAACDAPMRVRTNPTTVNGVNDGSGINTNGPGTGGFDPVGTTTGTTTGGGTTGNTSGGQSINCIKNAVAFHAGLGNVDVCQDSGNEVLFKLTFSTTDQSDGTCVVPMFKDSTGNSLYLGNAQCTKHNQGQSMIGQLNKNRPGHSGYQINSVMVLKYSGTNAFFQCMNGYGFRLNECMAQFGGNPFYQTYCQGQAQTYMTNLCNAFKNNYPYSQVNTRQ